MSAPQRSALAQALRRTALTMLLTFGVVVAFVVLREPLPVLEATRLLSAAGLLLATVAAREIRRARSEPTAVLVAMFLVGSLAISLGVLHILIGAGLARPSGLWTEAQPWPAAFTTVGGTLIGFAGILWSLSRQQAFADHERRVREYARRTEALGESVTSVEMLLDDCKRLSREALRVLREVIEPLGEELLTRTELEGTHGQLYERAELFRFLAAAEPPPHIGDGQRLDVRNRSRPGAKGWVPTTSYDLHRALHQVAMSEPDLARGLARRIDVLTLDLWSRSRDWLVEYSEVRRRLAATVPEAPIDLMPFADDLELLREVIVAACGTEDDRREDSHALIAHLAMVLAALARRAELLADRRAENLPPVEGPDGQPADRVPDPLITFLDPSHLVETAMQRYANALVRTVGEVTELEPRWHWSDEFFDDVIDPLSFDDDRREAIARDWRTTGSPVRMLIRAFAAPARRRELKELAKLEHAQVSRLAADLFAETVRPSTGSEGLHAQRATPPSPRDFWNGVRDRLEPAALRTTRTALLPPPPGEHRRSTSVRPPNAARHDAWDGLAPRPWGTDVRLDRSPMDWTRDGPHSSKRSTATLSRSVGSALPSEASAAAMDWHEDGSSR